MPAAQEWSADLNRTLSRREKKKATDGVTLTGINQTGDQALQSKPSRWALGQPPSPGSSAWAGHSPVKPCREPPTHVFPDASRASKLCWVVVQGQPWEGSSAHLVPELWKDPEKGAFATHMASGPK